MKDFETWVKAWQGQAVLVVLNVILTDTLTEIFENSQTKRLKDVLNQVMFEIEALTKMIRTKITLNTRTSICSLLTNRVHARDALKNMIECQVTYAADFYWKMHMKYQYLVPPPTPARNMLAEFKEQRAREGKDDGNSEDQAKPQGNEKKGIKLNLKGLLG